MEEFGDRLIFRAKDREFEAHPSSYTEPYTQKHEALNLESRVANTTPMRHKNESPMEALKRRETRKSISSSPILGLDNYELKVTEISQSSDYRESGLKKLKSGSLESIARWEKENEFLFALIEDESEWLTRLFPEENITPDNFFSELEDGVVLCKLARLCQNFAEDYGKAQNIKIPSFVITIHARHKCRGRLGQFMSRENVELFLNWCRRHKIPEPLLFESNDVVEKTEKDGLREGAREIVLCLMEVARLGVKFGVQPPKLILLEKEIEEEELFDTSLDGSISPGSVDSGVETSELEMLQNYYGDRNDSFEGSDNNMSFDVDEETPSEGGHGRDTVDSGHRGSITSEGDTSGLDSDRSAKRRRKFGAKSQQNRGKNNKNKDQAKGDKNFVKSELHDKMLNDHVIVRIGGGWDTLEHYIMTHLAKVDGVLKNILGRSSRPEVFLGKGVLKICSKFTGEHPYRIPDSFDSETPERRSPSSSFLKKHPARKSPNLSDFKKKTLLSKSTPNLRVIINNPQLDTESPRSTIPQWLRKTKSTPNLLALNDSPTSSEFNTPQRSASPPPLKKRTRSPSPSRRKDPYAYEKEQKKYDERKISQAILRVQTDVVSSHIKKASSLDWTHLSKNEETLRKFSCIDSLSRQKLNLIKVMADIAIDSNGISKNGAIPTIKQEPPTPSDSSDSKNLGNIKSNKSASKEKAKTNKPAVKKTKASTLRQFSSVQNQEKTAKQNGSVSTSRVSNVKSPSTKSPASTTPKSVKTSKTTTTQSKVTTPKTTTSTSKKTPTVKPETTKSGEAKTPINKVAKTTTLAKSTKTTPVATKPVKPVKNEKTTPDNATKQNKVEKPKSTKTTLSKSSTTKTTTKTEKSTNAKDKNNDKTKKTTATKTLAEKSVSKTSTKKEITTTKSKTVSSKSSKVTATKTTTKLSATKKGDKKPVEKTPGETEKEPELKIESATTDTDEVKEIQPDSETMEKSDEGKLDDKKKESENQELQKSTTSENESINISNVECKAEVKASKDTQQLEASSKDTQQLEASSKDTQQLEASSKENTENVDIRNMESETKLELETNEAKDNEITSVEKREKEVEELESETKLVDKKPEPVQFVRSPSIPAEEEDVRTAVKHDTEDLNGNVEAVQQDVETETEPLDEEKSIQESEDVQKKFHEEFRQDLRPESESYSKKIESKSQQEIEEENKVDEEQPPSSDIAVEEECVVKDSISVEASLNSFTETETAHETAHTDDLSEELEKPSENVDLLDKQEEAAELKETCEALSEKCTEDENNSPSISEDRGDTDRQEKVAETEAVIGADASEGESIKEQVDSQLDNVEKDLENTKKEVTEAKQKSEETDPPKDAENESNSLVATVSESESSEKESKDTEQVDFTSTETDHPDDIDSEIPASANDQCDIDENVDNKAEDPKIDQNQSDESDIDQKLKTESEHDDLYRVTPLQSISAEESEQYLVKTETPNQLDYHLEVTENSSETTTPSSDDAICGAEASELSTLHDEASANSEDQIDQAGSITDESPVQESSREKVGEPKADDDQSVLVSAEELHHRQTEVEESVEQSSEFLSSENIDDRPAEIADIATNDEVEAERNFDGSEINNAYSNKEDEQITFIDSENDNSLKEKLDKEPNFCESEMSDYLKDKADETATGEVKESVLNENEKSLNNKFEEDSTVVESEISDTTNDKTDEGNTELVEESTCHVNEATTSLHEEVEEETNLNESEINDSLSDKTDEAVSEEIEKESSFNKNKTNHYLNSNLEKDSFLNESEISDSFNDKTDEAIAEEVEKEPSCNENETNNSPNNKIEEETSSSRSDICDCFDEKNEAVPEEIDEESTFNKSQMDDSLNDKNEELATEEVKKESTYNEDETINSLSSKVEEEPSVNENEIDDSPNDKNEEAVIEEIKEESSLIENETNNSLNNKVDEEDSTISEKEISDSFNNKTDEAVTEEVNEEPTCNENETTNSLSSKVEEETSLNESEIDGCLNNEVVTHANDIEINTSEIKKPSPMEVTEETTGVIPEKFESQELEEGGIITLFDKVEISNESYSVEEFKETGSSRLPEKVNEVQVEKFSITETYKESEMHSITTYRSTTVTSTTVESSESIKTSTDEILMTDTAKEESEPIDLEESEESDLGSPNRHIVYNQKTVDSHFEAVQANYISDSSPADANQNTKNSSHIDNVLDNCNFTHINDDSALQIQGSIENDTYYGDDEETY